jgi:hypothetical protein
LEPKSNIFFLFSPAQQRETGVRRWTQELVLSINRSKADVHRQAANVRNERVDENLLYFLIHPRMRRP